jgi:hypothetical protein
MGAVTRSSHARQQRVWRIVTAGAFLLAAFLSSPWLLQLLSVRPDATDWIQHPDLFWLAYIDTSVNLVWLCNSLLPLTDQLPQLEDVVLVPVMVFMVRVVVLLHPLLLPYVRELARTQCLILLPLDYVWHALRLHRVLFPLYLPLSVCR